MSRRRFAVIALLFLADDFTGRQIGAQIGVGAWNLARTYFDGSAIP